MHEYIPTRREVEQDEFDHKVNMLAEDWYTQLEEDGFISRNAPYGKECAREADLIKWAEVGDLYLPNASENIRKLLNFHAREWLIELAGGRE